jgi:hypothetical protein
MIMTDYLKYPRIAYTGGGDEALDGIDGSILKDGDACYVDVPGTAIHSVHILDADSGLDENSPLIVKPDSNAGDKRWVLARGPVGSLPALPFSCGRLSNYGGSSPFEIAQFVPYNGNKILIDGKIEIIPDGVLAVSGGVQGAYADCSVDKVLHQALASNTLYYVYVYMLAGVMTMDFSTTVQYQEDTYGTWVKTGDETCALVGMLYTNAASKTLGTAKQQTMVSHFNRLRYVNLVTVAGTVTDATPTELNSANRLEWVQWSDDLPITSVTGHWGGATIGNRVALGIGLNSASTVSGYAGMGFIGTASTPSITTFSTAVNPGGDGYFYATAIGFTNLDAGAGTATLSNGLLRNDNLAV